MSRHRRDLEARPRPTLCPKCGSLQFSPRDAEACCALEGPPVDPFDILEAERIARETRFRPVTLDPHDIAQAEHLTRQAGAVRHFTT